jgi:glucosamine--fructose-6-phosphate aminotransferase (isomerizing)
VPQKLEKHPNSSRNHYIFEQKYGNTRDKDFLLCGIIGYVGDGRAGPILFSGLRKLEYRGYDSAGACTFSPTSNGKKLDVRKDVGTVGQIEEKYKISKMFGSMGIAHTRWATHGGVTKKNSHPQVSNDGTIAVVHNGIIENFEELRNILKKKGFVFRSETDTEVLPNLIQLGLQEGKTLEDSVRGAISLIQGNYAFLIMKAGERNLFAARKGSPLVLGIGRNETFVASDIPAFLDRTKKVVYLYDYDVVTLEQNGYTVFNLAQNKFVVRETDTVDWDAKEVDKGSFEHYMLKEIMEQVQTIERATKQSSKVIESLANKIRKANGVFFVACGSSLHACLSASYVFSEVASVHVNIVNASEFRYYSHFLKRNTLVLAVSQSGETIDVLDAVHTAKSKGSRVISIVNVNGSSLSRTADESLALNAGPEVCVLSTKSYTSQLALLTLLDYAVGGSFKEGRKRMNVLRNTLYHLTSLTMRNRIQLLADELKDKEHLFTIGRGLLYPTALEAALKIKEVSYIHAEGYAGGELKHGPIALVEKGTPCIVFLSEETEKETISNAMELKSRGAYTIGVAPQNHQVFDFFIKVPEAQELSPICQIIPIQLLAYELALKRGLDPDKPRNLAKRVTVR